jgi:hypothetical protein
MGAILTWLDSDVGTILTIAVLACAVVVLDVWRRAREGEWW